MVPRKARRAPRRVSLGSQLVLDGQGRMDVYVSYLAGIECAPLPDVNIGRVGGRYFKLPSARRSELYAVAQRVAWHCPPTHPREFYWGILDLAAEICTPRT